MDMSGIINQIVSISQFNQGKASPLFARANNGETLLVVKNNAPVAVIVSPKEYEILRKISKICNTTPKKRTASDDAALTDLLNELREYDEIGG